MAFKLGKERREIKHPGNVGIVRTPLDSGNLAEARNDGTIAVNSNIDPNSALMKKVIKHEMKHMHDMNTGRADYGDEWVMWEGDIFLRREINGEKMIDGPNGRLPEGHEDHPWEAAAIAAEKQ